MVQHDKARKCLELVQEINSLYSDCLLKVNMMVDRLGQVRELCHEVTGEGVMTYLLTDDALQKFVGRAVEGEASP